MKLNDQQRAILRAKASQRVRKAPDDVLIALLVLMGYTLSEIEQIGRNF